MSDDLENSESTQDSGVMKALRTKLEERDAAATAAEQKLAQMERQMAFVDAGVPTSDPKAKYFLRGYEGDITPDAIKAAWQEAGFDTPTAPPVKDAVPPGELDAFNRMSQAAAQAPPSITVSAQAERDACRSEAELLVVLRNQGALAEYD